MEFPSFFGAVNSYLAGDEFVNSNTKKGID